MDPLKLVVVSAGLSRPSSTRLLADRLAEATRRSLDDGAGRPVDVRVIELRDLAVDIANNLVTGFPGAALSDAKDAVAGADGVIAVTPIFSASYSGLFKSFFDVIDNTELVGRPVLVAATGGTARHSLALDHALRPMFAYLRAVVVPTAVYAATDDWGGSAGGDARAEGYAEGHADGLAARVARAAGELADLMRGRPAAATAPDAVIPFEQQLAALRTGGPDG